MGGPPVIQKSVTTDRLSCRMTNEEVTEFVTSLSERGIVLSSHNGKLTYRAPKGVWNALPPEEIAKLQMLRGEIVDFLESDNTATESAAAFRSEVTVARAPLTFSQLAHWHLWELNSKPGIRQIASILRVTGELRVATIEESVREVVRRHSALRTRIVIEDGVPFQEVLEHRECKIAFEDLSGVPEEQRELEVWSAIEGFLLEQIDLEKDHLLGVRLLKVGREEHMLLIGIEHMISDLSSLGVVVEEIFEGYASVLTNEAREPRDASAQFINYAAWQAGLGREHVERHERYWREYLSGCGRVTFPQQQGLGLRSSGCGNAGFKIDGRFNEELRQWCRLRHTTMAVAVLTAYAGLVSRWCEAQDMVLLYQSDGRRDVRLQGAVGYFASPLYLRLVVSRNVTLSELLLRVKEEYFRAFANCDFCYLESRVPRPEFTRGPMFNWVPRRSEVALRQLVGTEDELSVDVVEYVHPLVKTLEMDLEPSVLIFDTEEELDGNVYYPLRRFSDESMKRFAWNLKVLVRELIDGEDQRLGDIDLV